MAPAALQPRLLRCNYQPAIMLCNCAEKRFLKPQIEQPVKNRSESGGSKSAFPLSPSENTQW